MEISGYFCLQILREIKFGESRNSKPAIFAIFGAVKFVNLVHFSLLKMQIFIEIKIHSLSMC